jgi:hypothetical protein
MQRHQLSRRKGFRLPPGVRSVAYPTRWENKQHPPTGQRSLEANAAAVAWYRGWLAEQLAADPAFLEPLRPCVGLACWCPLDWPCHADVLIEALRRSPHALALWPPVVRPCVRPPERPTGA